MVLLVKLHRSKICLNSLTQMCNCNSYILYCDLKQGHTFTGIAVTPLCQTIQTGFYDTLYWQLAPQNESCCIVELNYIQYGLLQLHELKVLIYISLPISEDISRTPL